MQYDATAILHDATTMQHDATAMRHDATAMQHDTAAKQTSYGENTGLVEGATVCHWWCAVPSSSSVHAWSSSVGQTEGNVICQQFAHAPVNTAGGKHPISANDVLLQMSWIIGGFYSYSEHTLSTTGQNLTCSQ